MLYRFGVIAAYYSNFGHCAFSSHPLKTRLNDLSYDTKIWTDLSSILSQSTRLTDRQTDGQMDGQREFSSLDRICIPSSAVKINIAHF